MFLRKLIKNNNRSHGFFKGNEFFTDKQVAQGRVQPYYVDRRLLLVINYIRLCTGKPLFLNSCGRDEVYNANEGGSSKSQHLIIENGSVKAADLDYIDSSDTYLKDLAELKEFILSNFSVLYMMGVRGLGFYPYDGNNYTFVHIDTRRQDYVSVWGLDSFERGQLESKAKIKIL